MKTYIGEKYIRLLVMLLALFAMAGSSVAQTVLGAYNLQYPATADGERVEEISIKHKPAKWYQDNIVSQRSSNDNFDVDNSMVTLENGTPIQATHTYVDTIYMRKGTSITLYIPNLRDDGGEYSSVNNYFRWFNYKNDKSFNVGDVYIAGDWPQDILRNYSKKAWRFGNGYVSGMFNYNVGYMNGYVWDEIYQSLRSETFYYPTDAEFQTILTGGGASNFTGLDNSYYEVACDLSSYTDFSDGTYEPNYGYTDSDSNAPAFGDGGEYYEPTLTGRVIYYIIGVDDSSTEVPEDLPKEYQHYWTMLNNSDYQGGGNDDGKKYLEEYEIAYPSQHISENSNDNEVLTLSKMAEGYAIRGESGSETLDVQFAPGEDNGFTLVANTLSGTGRVIQFYKGYTNSQWSVDDGSTATILVTKTVGSTTYNIARYKLTFKNEIIPLTEAQVAALDEKETLDENTWDAMWWKEMDYRSQNYLDNNCTLLASLDFDYDGSGYGDSDKNTRAIYDAISNGTTDNAERFNYPFPLDWSSSGCLFYDGSFDVNPFTTTTVSLSGYTYHTQRMLYNTYGIVNSYVANAEFSTSTPWEPTCQEVKNHDGNWLYINPTEKPVKIAELSFKKDELEMGSKLLVSAWMRNVNNPSSGYDAAVLFTLMGVKADGTEEPIYFSNSGQIECTNGWVGITDLGENNLDASITGKGSGTNEWYQVFFTYVLKKGDINNYDHYAIRVNNNCSIWQNDGYYFDELKVYKQDPVFDAAITPVEDVRSVSDTPFRLDIDYEELMSCMGLSSSDYSSGSTDTQNLDFILINKDKYDDSIEGGADATTALKDAIVSVSYVKEEDGEKSVVTTQNPGVDFYCYYGGNGAYDTDAAGYNFPMDGLLTYTNDDGTSMLSADFNAKVSADSTYLVIINLSSDDDGSKNAETITDDKLAVFAELVESQYVAETKFDAITEDETRGGYQTSYASEDVTEAEVNHKAGRWYQDGIISQSASDDDFDSDNSMFALANSTKLQVTHTYVDTIYLKKGTSIDLVIPNVDSDAAENASMNNYYRWFNYLNDKNFFVGNGIYGKGATNYDLLTKGSESYNAWTFGNGYVSGLLNTTSTNTSGNGETNTLRKVTFYYPTDDEYVMYIKSRNLEDFNGQDNSYYAVACDLSNYTDFAETFTAGKGSDFSADNDYYEPTLQGRALFYIIGIDEDSTDASEDLPEKFHYYWTMLNDGNYQGGTDEDGKKYLEEYEITFPSQRISGNTNDNEVVTLSKEAQAYGIPGESGTGYLKVEFADGEANGLTIAESTLSGTSRVIQFFNGTSGTQWSVDDGSKATILVTKEAGGKTYNIARYKLTFKKESIPLTEAQVAALDKQSGLDADTWDKMWWKDLSERAPSYLANCELLDSLVFDYEGSGYGDDDLNSRKVYNGNGERFNYPFPMDWDINGLAFYDGSLDINPLGSDTETGVDSYT
ncbi:MAG: hypothetical protein LUD48_04440, partial [Prevotella sp.]|nr:hypothetical protein [Prevotella sp.]